MNYSYFKHVITPSKNDDAVKELPYASKFKELYEKSEVAKKKWDIYEGNKGFYTITRKVFPFSDLKGMLEDKFNIKPATIAWLKTYEMVYRLKSRIPTYPNSINIFFNANLPGASTYALDYFFKTQMPSCRMEWVASSYVGGETTLEDKYGLLKNNPDNWLVDDKNNGDVTKVDNVIDMVKKSKKKFKGKCHLYFSDIAIDIKNDYANEERNEVKEVFGQNICGLLALDHGGIMIVKQRSFLLPFNIWMISKMAMYFEEFSIDKPISSRPYNAEVYLIGVGFKGISEADKDMLLTILSKFKSSYVDKIPTTVNIDVIKNILAAAKNITEQQIEALNDCVKIFEASRTTIRASIMEIDRNTESTREQFIKDFKIKISPQNVIKSNI